MKKIATLFIIVLTTFSFKAQTLYTKTFGNPKDKPVIFLHGGPGYNCANFEATTAKRLSENGFYVVVYDRRGEGRSLDTKAKYTYQQTFEDLSDIYKLLNLKNATLLGHSFGGVVATLFTEKYSEKVDAIVLIGSPVALQETFTTILRSSKKIYDAKKDSVNLGYISMLENMDKTSLEYSSYCFGHAMQNGFYYPKKMTDEAKEIYKTMRKDTLIKKYASQMGFEAPQGFWRNEKYTTIDLTSNLKTLVDKNVKIYGLYGKDDGLYSNEQVDKLQSIIGKNNLMYFDNCSHNVFIDQQIPFIEALKIRTK